MDVKGKLICIYGLYGSRATWYMINSILEHAGYRFNNYILDLGYMHYVLPTDPKKELQVISEYGFGVLFPDEVPYIACIPDKLYEYPLEQEAIIRKRHQWVLLAEKALPRTSCIVCRDNADFLRTLPQSTAKKIVFGKNENSDLCIESICIDDAVAELELYYHGRYLASVSLLGPSEEKILGCQAAACIALALDIEAKYIGEGLSAYQGKGRIMEYKGKFRESLVFSDGSSAPEIIHGLLLQMKKWGTGRTICLFQPFRRREIVDFLEQYHSALAVVDVVLISDTCPHYDKDLTVAKELERELPNALYFTNDDLLVEELCGLLQKNDLILTLGSKEIHKLASFKSYIR